MREQKHHRTLLKSKKKKILKKKHHELAKSSRENVRNPNNQNSNRDEELDTRNSSEQLVVPVLSNELHSRNSLEEPLDLSVGQDYTPQSPLLSDDLIMDVPTFSDTGQIYIKDSLEDQMRPVTILNDLKNRKLFENEEQEMDGENSNDDMLTGPGVGQASSPASALSIGMLEFESAAEIIESGSDSRGGLNDSFVSIDEELYAHPVLHTSADKVSAAENRFY